ncbi:hypothetical protein, partial [Alkalibacterium sp.]|uniref:hypothetical protein n=1 Tax=Alkalibacterium sp. TaxID=1872447 RepID=UPI00397047BE
MANGPKFKTFEKSSQKKAIIYCFNGFTAMSKNIFLWYGTNISPDSALNINKGTLLIYPLSVSVNESDNRTDYLVAARYYCLGFEEWDGISRVDVGLGGGTFLFGRGNQYLEYA